MFEPCQLNKVTQDLICICRQKTFSPVSSINSSQTDKALPVKTSKPNFVTFLVYFGGTACLIFCEISLVFYEFGVVHSEELGVEQ